MNTNFSLFPDAPQKVDMKISDFINTPKKVTDWLFSLPVENIKEVALIGGLSVINGSKKELLEYVINQLLSLDQDYKELILKGKVLDVFNLKENEAHLELHGYKMINTDDGSRLTEFDEKPDFYDVSVLFYNDKSGEIDPVEEFEDILTFDKANIIMGALEKKYKSISLFGEWVN